MKGTSSVAQVTIQMGRADRDFGKGVANGARDAFRIIEAIARLAPST